MVNKGLDEALDLLLEEEGGWSNHPADKGGATMYGITQAVYDGWRKDKGRLKQSVKKIAKSEARELYEELYWKAASCHKLPWPISYLVFDAAVNSGVSRGVRWMQAGLGLSQDGKVGPLTVEKANQVLRDADGQALFQIVDQRVQFLAALIRRSPSQVAFLLGWWRRTLRVLGRALTAELEED